MDVCVCGYVHLVVQCVNVRCKIRVRTIHGLPCANLKSKLLHNNPQISYTTSCSVWQIIPWMPFLHVLCFTGRHLPHIMFFEWNFCSFCSWIAHCSCLFGVRWTDYIHVHTHVRLHRPVCINALLTSVNHPCHLVQRSNWNYTSLYLYVVWHFCCTLLATTCILGRGVYH